MANTSVLPDGTTLRLMFQGCRCDSDYLLKPGSILPQIWEAIQNADLTPLSDMSHEFEDGGYTAALILAESHVAIHTWPEFDNLVLVDVSVCDFYRNNRERTLTLGNRLAELFSPTHVVQEILNMIPRLSETCGTGMGNYAEIKQILDSRQSAYQDIMVADTKRFGQTLILDGWFQTSQNDEFFYHEPLVHIPLLAHSNPKNVLVCGGGDGGAVRDALKHPSVEKCVLVDIDAEVIEVSRELLESIHQGALNDPRVEIHAQDAAEYIQTTDEEFDTVILDTTDPGSCADTLFTNAFFKALAMRLNDDGIFSMHIGAPLNTGDETAVVVQRVQQVFDNLFPYTHYVPGYGTVMAFLLGQISSDELPPYEPISARIEDRELHDLKIITPDTYHALFAVPPVFQKYFPGIETHNPAKSNAFR